jgi:polyisoprenoid-binding protein YceI
MKTSLLKNKLKLSSLFAGALIVASAVTMSFTPNNPNTGEITSSSIKWVGKKVTGEHSGTIAFTKQNLIFDKGVLKGGSFEVDMSTIEVTDISGLYAKKLEGHLKADDFFGVEKFPTALLTIKKVELKSANNYTITADLTIKGKTNSITFNAVANEEDTNIVFDSKVVIDRTKYGIEYKSGSFFEELGDKMIYDDFDLNIHIVTTK